MRSHIAARQVVRRCLGRHDATAACPSSSCLLPTSCCVHRPAWSQQSQSQPRQSSRQLHATAVTSTLPKRAVPSSSFSSSIFPPQLPKQQRRTFLGALRRPPPRKFKEQQVDPGYDVLLEFRASVTEDTRRPARAELLQAFRDFFGYKYQYSKRINTTQAQWMRKMFVYLAEEGGEERDGGSGVPEIRGDELREAREALLKVPFKLPSSKAPWSTAAAADAVSATADHLALCRLIYSELQRRGTARPADFRRHMAALCQYGASLEAMDLFRESRQAGRSDEYKGSSGTPSSAARREKETWLVVLRGLANEGREAELLREAAEAEASGLEYMPLFHEVMTTFYARRNDLTETRAWFMRPIAHRLLPTAQTYRDLLAFGERARQLAERRGREEDVEAGKADKAEMEAVARGKELQARRLWVQVVFQELCDANPSKELWDMILQWAVVALDKGVDDVRRMMDTMDRRHAGRSDNVRSRLVPDAATIHGLVEAAVSRGDVLLAERFVQLGDELQIVRDLRTHTLQLDYRVSARDLSGAHASFAALQNALLEAMDGGEEHDVPLQNGSEEDPSGQPASSSLPVVTDDDIAAAEPVVNRYIRALCTAAEESQAPQAAVMRLSDVVEAVEGQRDHQLQLRQPPHFESGDSDDRQPSTLPHLQTISLEPETVVALCMALLHHDRHYDVIDVLSVHALQYSVEERAVVRDAFIEYIERTSSSLPSSSASSASSASSTPSAPTSTSRAWDAYMLLRQFFAETPATSRMRIMDSFFRRRRSDMACLVFGHVRSAADPALRPTADMYVRCFQGLARISSPGGGSSSGDTIMSSSSSTTAISSSAISSSSASQNGYLQSLHMVHNMLKMDARIQPDTRLYTALMIAYAACGDRPRALEFWHDISASVEGPSYHSLAAVFWVCERLPFGDAPARSVWAKIQRMEIDVPPFVYDAYCAAMAGQGHMAETQRLIESMVRSAGYGPTPTTLGICYNALPGQDLQSGFVTWATSHYPDLWQETSKRRCRADANGLRRYDFPREFKA